MGLFKELRSSIENPASPLSFPAEWLLDMFVGGRTDSGIRVSEYTALQVSTVLACVDLISGAIAGLPLNVYEQIKRNNRNARIEATDHDLFGLLHDAPNDEMTSYTFRKALQAHMLLWGNGYAELQRDNGNRIVAMWPRNPAKTKPHRVTQPTVIQGERVAVGDMVYTTTEGEGQSGDPDAEGSGKRYILMNNMLHMPGLALDGRVGQGVVYLTRQILGLALASEKFGNKLFANGIRTSGVFTLPENLSPEGLENFKRSLREAYGGENQHMPMIIEQGMDWKPIASTADEAQFLQTREFQKLEICSVFHVPPHMVAETKGASRGSNVEQIATEFVTFTLTPWLTNWEQELKRKLFGGNRVGRNAARIFMPKFDIRNVMHPDAESRKNFYQAGKQWGFLNTNDIRELEDMNPVDSEVGEMYWMPVNMMDADNPTTPIQPGGSQPNDPTDGNELPAEPPKVPPKKTIAGRQLYSNLFKDAFNRALVRDSSDSKALQRVFMPVLAAIADYSCAEQNAEFVTGDLLPDEITTFVVDYIGAMGKRSKTWKQNTADEQVNIELDRAIRAINIAVSNRETSMELRKIKCPTTV